MTDPVKSWRQRIYEKDQLRKLEENDLKKQEDAIYLDRCKKEFNNNLEQFYDDLDHDRLEKDSVILLDSWNVGSPRDGSQSCNMMRKYYKSQRSKVRDGLILDMDEISPLFCHISIHPKKDNMINKITSIWK
jgi:hypothetical protein